MQDNDQSTLHYVIELQDKLTESLKIVAQNAEVSAIRHKAYFDVKYQVQQFQPSNEGLVLLSSDTSKLLVAWEDPFKILKMRDKVDCFSNCPKGPRLYYAIFLSDTFDVPKSTLLKC